MSSPEPPVTKGSILIVDDTPSNLRLLSSMLSRHGYEVRSAISGSVALMAIHTVYPDLILLDINMPKMNGYEVCVQLKSQPETRDIPVIFLSALSELGDKVQAFQSGGVDYITKPFHVEEVLARVENQLTLRRVQTELQQAKADALRALEQEKELSRLKTEFVAMISHDFRTPLTSIQGFAELLHYSSDKLTPDLRERYFDKINASVEHMIHLLDEVLLIGGLETGHLLCRPIALDLQPFCQDLVETLQLNATIQHPIRCHYQGNIHLVALDPTLLTQILTNILSNAMKYSPEGETIDLEVACEPERVTFSVRDRGIGIPPESQSQLFDPFYRCSNVGNIRGTGLGLAVVKRCVEVHHGLIQLDSQLGQGTTVMVQLPWSRLTDLEAGERQDGQAK